MCKVWRLHALSTSVCALHVMSMCACTYVYLTCCGICAGECTLHVAINVCACTYMDIVSQILIANNLYGTLKYTGKFISY